MRSNRIEDLNKIAERITLNTGQRISVQTTPITNAIASDILARWYGVSKSNRFNI